MIVGARAIALPFEGAAFGLDKRNHNQCPRTLGPYQFCDAITKCCQPGYGCNTCGEGNVGQTCVKRQKDNCKSDKDCSSGQKCIQNEAEGASFCAQLWVDNLPQPTATKRKKKTNPAHGLNPSSLNPSSLAPSSLAPSSFIMATPTAIAPQPGPPASLQPTEKPGPPAATASTSISRVTSVTIS